MKRITKKRAFMLMSMLCTFSAFVFSFAIIGFSKPTNGNLFCACMVFTLCILGALGYLSLFLDAYKKERRNII